MVRFIERFFKREPTPEPIHHTRMTYVEDHHNPYIDEACPECGSKPIWVGNSCHTYESFGKWVSCMNCGSAGDLYCENEECNWGYEWGLNPDNPRAADNERNRPSWLIGEWPY